MAFSKNRRLSDIISDTSGNLSAVGLVVPTQSNSDNDTSAASTAFVHNHIDALVDSAPGTMNTLNEIAAALNDDANFNTTVTNSIAAKLPLAGGTLTGNLTMGGMMLKPSGDGGSIGFNRNPDNGNHVGDSGKRRFQINGPDDTGGDFLQIQSYNSSGSHQGNINIIDGKVGIGISNPSQLLNLKSNTPFIQFTQDGTDSYAGINFGDDDDANDGQILYDHDSRYMRFQVANAERVRINASGTLLVGTTDDAHYGGSSNTGLAVFSSGITGISRSGGTVLYANRQSNDGDIITFRKDGSLIGHAGTYGGAFYVGGSTNGSNGSGLMFNGVDIEPTTGSTGRTDGAIDLGSSSYRFQHLRFSGGLYGGSELQLSRVGIGTAAGSSIASNSSNVEGLFFHNSTGEYRLGRTAGSWTGPNYQQMIIDWDTGVIIDGGTAYGKSGVEIRGPVASSNGGMVLQTQEAYHNSAITTSGSGVTIISTTITVLANSRLAVWFNSGQILSSGNLSNPNFTITVDGSNISDQNSNHYFYDTGKGTSGRIFMQGQAISPALSAGTRTVAVVGNVYNGSATFNYQSQGAHLIIQEISKDL